MPGDNKAGMGTSSDGDASGIGNASTVTKHYGRVKIADLSDFTVIRDGDGERISVNEKTVTDSDLRGDKNEVGSRVVFTTSFDGSQVLSLRKCDENEATGSGEAAKEADKPTKSG